MLTLAIFSGLCRWISSGKGGEGGEVVADDMGLSTILMH